MTLIAEDLAAGREITPIQRVEIEEAYTHDSIFLTISLGWWVS